jgi:cytochrome P450
MGDVWMTETVVSQGQWVKEYGSTLRFKGFFGANRLLTIDTCAITHILSRTSDYPKPSYIRYAMAKLLGNGLLCVDGDQHRQQRRVLNPAFGPAQIRALTDIFFAKAIKLRDICSSEIAKNPTVNTTGTRIDMVLWLNRATLDMIGLAGFNYHVDALNTNEKLNELNEAFSAVTAIPEFGILAALQACIPPLRLITDDSLQKIQVGRRTVARIGRELLKTAKVAARASATETGEIEKSSIQGRDLFTLLVKANMATDIPENQRMSDEEVLAQFSTFLAVGHESTSTATTWAFRALAHAHEIQAKLREELLSVDTDTPSMDDLIALPYLDAVVKETLRVYPPFPHAPRSAVRDDIVPLKRPFTDKHGVVHDRIRITKGDSIIIPILAMNTSEELWGPDAHEFKPERWANLPEAVSDIPGVWSHLPSFLSGPKGCIGYRFAVVEMKALLFTLVRAFEFELAVPDSEMVGHWNVVQRPCLRGDPSKRPQLPILLKSHQRE